MYKVSIMEFRQLQLFVAVAEELHFGRAAARVRMAQPPFSQQIRKLEEELGVRLLARSSRRVALTPAGAQLLEHARALLVKRAEAVTSVQRVAEGDTGMLRIGFGASSAFGVLPELIRRFREKYPGIALRMEDRESLDIGHALANGELDVAIVRAPFRYVGVDTESLWRERFMLALPEGHSMAQRRRITLASLANEPFVLFPRETAPGLHDTIVSICIEAGFSPAVMHQAVSWPAVISLVKAGLGVTIAPASAQAVLPGGVVFRNLPGVTIQAELLLAYARHARSVAAERFRAVALSSRA